MKLSDNFDLEEFTSSEIAQKKGIKNEPNKVQQEAIKELVLNVLQPARTFLGFIIYILSGFRSKELNEDEDVRGSKTSQHTKGEAADCKCRDNARLFNYIASYCIFDQLIWEYGNDQQPDWVHVSFRADGKNRMKKLRAVREEGKTKYKNI